MMFGMGRTMKLTFLEYFFDFFSRISSYDLAEVDNYVNDGLSLQMIVVSPFTNNSLLNC